ncbi:MAG: flagellar basal body rod protein FlgC [Candidatus Zixiibacteriota bacterium]
MSGIFTAIETSATGLTLQRRKMNVVAENIANAETTKTEKGGPYRRQRVVVEESPENVPFKTHMVRAGAKLARTHANHIGGHLKPSTEETEISQVDGEVIQEPAANFRLIYDPSHPDANEEGFVKMPDIEIVNEMVDMMAATRAYEANTMAISAAKEMAKNSLEI